MKLEQEKELLGVRIQKVLSLLKYSGTRSDYRKSALSERKKILSEVLNTR